VPVCARINHHSQALTDRPANLQRASGTLNSDEILHRAGLSPVALTQKLAPEAIKRLYEPYACDAEWTGRLRTEAQENSGKSHRVQAGDAVHGRFGKSCLSAARRVQRIRYAETKPLLPALPTDGRVLRGFARYRGC